MALLTNGAGKGLEQATVSAISESVAIRACTVVQCIVVELCNRESLRIDQSCVHIYLPMSH